MVPYKNAGKVLAIALSFISVGLFFSCKKTDIINNPTEQPVDFSKKIIASVNGFVTNEYSAPVAGATVQYGESSSTTDRYGYFEIKNATVTENAAPVTVNMNGYFKGIKTFVAEAGRKNFCRIKLIPKSNSGSVDAALGGDVTLSNGLKVSLPASGIMDAATKAPYSGIVSVSSSWINPIADDVNEIMPGDLRGINTNGSLRSLTSFGMAAVELTGSAGQLLQIADGKIATLTFPLPNIIAADAPASIPLWYFDEIKGLWVEEGSATKSGNSYVGDVKHFTFWNVDIPNPAVPVSFIIIDSSNNPVNNVYVVITPTTGNTHGSISGFTDETGYVNVPVTANTTYRVQFSNSCLGASPFSKNFSVETKAVDLGRIAVSNTLVVKFSGIATNCSNMPLTNGRIVIRDGNSISMVPVDNQGAFTGTIFKCANLTHLDFIAQDLSSSQQGQLIRRSINTGSNNIGNLQACGINTNEYANLIINGKSYVLGPRSDGMINAASQAISIGNLFGIGFNTTLSTQINGINFTYDDQLTWSLTHSDAIGSINKPSYLYRFSFFPGAGNPSDTTVDLVPIAGQTDNSPGSLPISITEYGGVGEYISGYFNSFLYPLIGPNTAGDTTKPYHVIYSFRTSRDY